MMCCLAQECTHHTLDSCRDRLQYLQCSQLGERSGVTQATVYKWKKRTSFQDCSHTAQRLQTTLTPAQERVVVELRRMLLLPLDYLLAVTREFICAKATRSGMDRCLCRHGVGDLNALKPVTPRETPKSFKSYEAAYRHIDVKYLPQMADESKQRICLWPSTGPCARCLWRSRMRTE